jgi:hypothetical protein
MKKYYIRFLDPYEIPTTRDAFEVSYAYKIVEGEYFNQPEQDFYTNNYSLKVGITGRMDAAWRAKDKSFNLMKVLFEFGKRHVIQKLKDKTIQEKEELIISSTTHPDNCPFDSSRIDYPNDKWIEIKLENEPIMKQEEFSDLAAFIIDTRDNINTLFHKLHNDKLFFLHQERDLLQLFRNAQSPEEYIFRVNSLRNIIISINVTKLIEIVNDNQTDNKSINLFERYLKKEFSKDYEDSIIKIFRHINRLRMSYPIHSDKVDGIIEALKYFGLIYPIDDFTNAWKTILTHYRNSLEILLEMFKKKVFS